MILSALMREAKEMLDKNIIETYLSECIKTERCDLRFEDGRIKNEHNKPECGSAANQTLPVQTLPIVELHDCLDSTNERCKNIARSTFKEHLVIAREQSAGRGRQGRQFFSPKNTGIYFSLLIFPNAALDAGTLMAKTALCICDVCEKFCFQEKRVLQIKWPNDIYYKNKKVAGILIESAQRKMESAQSKNAPYYIIGIGINVFEPADGWPDELTKNKNCPNALLDAQAKEEMPDLCNKLIAYIAGRLFAFCYDSSAEENYGEHPCTTKSTNDIKLNDKRTAVNVIKKQLLKAYIERSMLNDKQVEAQRGNEHFFCAVLGVDDNFCLRVRKEDNTEVSLSSGEVHLKL